MSSSFKLKTVFSGGSATGKTSIISAFMQDTFVKNTLTTIAPEKTFKKKLSPPTKRKSSLKVWDTAWQERYRSVNKIYYKEAKIAFVVYDISEPKSFEEAETYWIPETKSVLGDTASKSLLISDLI